MVARYTERVQIMLRQEDGDKLKKIAAERDTEVSPMLRRVIERFVEDNEPWEG